MYSPTVYQSNHSHNNAGGASTSAFTTRPPPSPSRQTYFQPSTPPNPAAARGRHRKLQELQHLDKEIQLLQVACLPPPPPPPPAFEKGFKIALRSRRPGIPMSQCEMRVFGGTQFAEKTQSRRFISAWEVSRGIASPQVGRLVAGTLIEMHTWNTATFLHEFTLESCGRGMLCL